MIRSDGWPIPAKEKQKAFFEVGQRFREARDLKEVERLGDQLGHFVCGE